MPHEPVLVRETLGFLLQGAGLYLDATLGDGGHAVALLAAEPNARLLACDRDLAAITFSRERLATFGGRVSFAHATFAELPQAHALAGGELLAGALFDFGLSSRQIDDPTRGISFMQDGPLDLRMDVSRGESLADRLAHASETELAQALRLYGDVRGAGRLARALLADYRAGRLTGTRALSSTVARVVGDSRPAVLAPVFQALRIWVNDEMQHVDAALEWLPVAMRDGGVVVTLAYHSGEDRRVKRALRGEPQLDVRRRPQTNEAMTSVWEELTRRVVVPGEEELSSNPRARSARLRAFRRRPR